MWLENEIGGPITETNLAPITHLCANVSWHDDIVLNITTPGGGVGNLRTLILDFIYFAMQTGSHIILPSYIKRTEKTLYWLDESNGSHSFSHLFDTEFLISTLRTACPEMRVFQTIVEAEINGTVTEVFDLQGSRTDKVVDTNPREKISRFRKWVDTKPEGYQDEAVNMVTIGVPLFTHDMHTKPRMRMALGRLLKFNNKIRELAATVLFNLRRSRKLEAEIDPSKQIYHGAYYGMHLRTEIDAGETWGGYEAQAIAHLDLCKKLNLSLIYVATGNQGDVVRFADEAQQVGITVISKQDLYSTVEEQAVFDSSALDSLSWDQKGVLDYEILSRSSFFSGPAASSFTWNLVLRRAFYIDDERLDRTYAYGIAEVEPGVVYDDGLSRIDLRRGSAEKVDTLEFLAPEGMYP
ncbi:hypothetical protein N0V93_009859 [Gnomoniopsis smithogilvyi]|uniref:O-fucosyltransferase family protein n=1 Tax=Gnomoniopsis smithogilvyi TaxID=1191159 RepID=A0A9W8YIX4_9PEZI|nr:hypothetical protein N0V93_009859 [Gnomoniopsis smithogilvyi]